MRRILLGIGALLLLAGCASEKPSFDQAVYDLALPYSYTSAEQEDFYVSVICDLEHKGINREYQIMAVESLSGVNNTRVTSNYINLVIDYKCNVST